MITKPRNAPEVDDESDATDLDDNESQISKVRKISVTGLNFCCEIVSSYREDSFKDLKQHVNDMLKSIKKIDNGEKYE